MPSLTYTHKRGRNAGKSVEHFFDEDDRDLAEKCRAVYHHRSGRPKEMQISDGRKLHREIAKRSGIDGAVIDHIDGNPFNNRRGNLRGASHSLNCRNRSYRGFSILPDGKFVSQAARATKPYRFAGDVGHEIDRKELESAWPGKKIHQGRSGGVYHLFVRPLPQKLFDTKEDAVAYYERCRLIATGSHEGRRA